MKQIKITYWISTILIVLFEGLLPALTFRTELARTGISHLGYPEYFGNAIVAFKILGALALIMPMVSKNIKEWAYAGFTFTFLFACISHWTVDGFSGQTVFPLIVLGILALSYFSYQKLEILKTRV